MAINLNAKSTTYPSFTIGKNGATIYQGTSAPSNGTGNPGDLYLYINGSNSATYQFGGSSWIQSAGSGSVTSVVAGAGLTGGTITSAGTISLPTVGSSGTYNNVTTDTFGRVTAGSNAAYLTANQNITITGDASGAGSTAITLALGTTGVTAGTYGDSTHFTAFTVDAKGRLTQAGTFAIPATGVTSVATGTGLIGGPVTTTGTISMSTSGVSAGTYGAGTQFPQIVVDALGRVTSATTISLGSISAQDASNVTITGGTITGLPTPTSASDAANKAYVDATTAGLSAKSSSRVATIGTNLVGTYNNGASGVGATFTFTGTGNVVIDGVTLNVNDRALIKDQTSQFQNGIYSVTVAGGVGTSAVLTRTTDFNSNANISEGAYTVIEEGTVNKGTLWLETGQGPFTIGTTSVIAFTELTVAPQTTQYTGDVTGTGAGTVALTLATVNSNVGTFGNTTNIPTITVNAKGLITAISNTAITYGTGSVTSVVAGTDLTGGTITNTGTLNLAAQAGVTPGTYQGIVVNNKGIITSASNQSYLTANQNITVTGDATGNGSTAITLTLGSVNSNAGTFSVVTVGTKGLVTAATNLVASGDATGTASGTALALTIANNAVTTAKINNAAVTYAKIQNETASTLLGNPNGTTQAPQEITLGTGMVFTGTTLAHGTSGVTAGTYGNGSNVPQITVDALGRVTAASNVSFTTGGNTKTITQTAHGFATGSVLALSGTTYVTALADTVADAEVVGIVSGTVDANNFILTSSGYVGGLTGLTAGSVYFLSPSSAGALTATAPSTVGQISKPIFIADTTTSGYFYNMRGEVLGTNSLVNGSSLVGNSGAGSANPTSIAVGTGLQITGNTLRATSGFYSGLVNKFRNGCMDIWQRGNSGTITAGAPAYTADGWIVSSTGANITWSKGGGIQFSGSSLLLTGATSVTDTSVKQRIESLVSGPFNNQFLMFQAILFNLSGATLTPTLTVNYPTSSDNYTSVTNIISAVSLQPIANNTAGVVSYTFQNAAQINGLEVILDFGAALNAGTKTINISQLDIRAMAGALATGTGNSVPPAELRPVGVEMPICQRYLQIFNGNGSDVGMGFVGQCFGTSNALLAVPFMTPMRVVPTFGTVGSFAFTAATSGRLGITALTINASNAASTTQALLNGAVASGLVAGNATTLWSSSATAYLQFSAEL